MMQNEVSSHKDSLLKITRRLALLAGLALLVYLPALRAGFIWDDDAYVTGNAALKSLRGLWEIWFLPGQHVQYYPLTFTSLWLNYHWGGLQPMGYHLVNILLHALNALFVWKLLEKLKVPGAWFAGLVFLLHPVHVESVAWITERKNVLSGCFYLLSLLSYLRFKEKGSRLWPWYFASFLCFLAALFSKTVTGTLPVTILLILGWKETRFPQKDLIRMIPFLILAAGLGFITSAIENRHMAAIGTADWIFSPADRVLIAGRALWFYLGKLLWPHPSTLAFIYPRWQIDPTALGQWLFPLSFILLMFLLWSFRSKWGRGPWTALACFTITLLPALGFKDFFPMRFSFVADHFQYLASIGPIACAVALAGISFGKHPRLRRVLAVGLLLILGAFSWKQCGIYKDLGTLWRDTLSKNPGTWLAHNNLAAVLIEQGQYEEAGRHLEAARQLRPNDANTYSNLGALATALNDFEKASQYYRQALILAPGLSDIHNDFGVSLFKSGKTDPAIKCYENAIRLNPKDHNALCNLGNAYLRKGAVENAIRQYEKAIELSPEFANAYANLGVAFVKLGQLDRAIEVYKKALQLGPAAGLTHGNLGYALAEKGSLEQAAYHLQEAVRLEPRSTDFRVRYAILLEKLGRTDEAILQYNTVLEQDPQDPDAQKNLLKIAFQGFPKKT